MRKLVGTVSLVVAFALLVVALWPAAIGAQTSHTIPGGVYEVTFVDTAGGCSVGEFTVGPATLLRLNPHGTRVTSLVANDLETPILDFAQLSIPTDIPIGEDGCFEGTFDPMSVGLVTVHLEGRFDAESVTGTFSIVGVDTLECAGTFSGPGVPPPPGQPILYEAAIDAVDGDCGSGELALRTSASGLSIIDMGVADVAVHGVLTDGAATFAEGAVPIAEIGSFGWVYFPGSAPGQEIAVIGRLDSSGRVDGWLTVSPSTCGPIPFVGLPALVLPSIGGPQGPQRGGGLLPSVGSGGAGSATVMPLWAALAAGTVGFTCLLAGAALRRKER